jgi:hypothetical protein
MHCDCSKDMAVHVSTCSIYDLNTINTLCGSCDTDKMRVFSMSYQKTE